MPSWLFWLAGAWILFGPLLFFWVNDESFPERPSAWHVLGTAFVIGTTCAAVGIVVGGNSGLIVGVALALGFVAVGLLYLVRNLLWRRRRLD